jgi:selenide,water dikinase
MHEPKIKLTRHTRFSGCGAKLGPGLLDRALCELTQPEFPELLADYRNADDAGVWRLDNENALVHTLDFFPPIVDDPFVFGRIAAANALSDVWAMGGRPITAMSIVAFPVDSMDITILRRISAGALDALKEAGTALVGGHSIKDDELKFGLAVTGLVHPDRIYHNNTLRAGDILVLTKPIGTGTINRALKADKASDEAVRASMASMSVLNGTAAAILGDFNVSACTDVTGFGLLGHACEMLLGSGCHITINLKDIQVLPGAISYIADGLVPGGTTANREHRQSYIQNAEDLSEDQLNLLFDPQTSGGLLAAVAPEDIESMLENLHSHGISAFVLGSVQAGNEAITVLT